MSTDRVIGFAEEMMNLEVETEKHRYVGHNSESHMTLDYDYRGFDTYEDYGVLSWLNKDGGMKKRKKFDYIIFEDYDYRTRDYYKQWSVPVQVGNYLVAFKCSLDKTSLHLYELEGVDFHTGPYARKFSTLRTKLIGKIEEDWREDYYGYYHYEDGKMHYNLKKYNLITSKMVREVFKKKFWKALDEIIKIPDFPVKE